MGGRQSVADAVLLAPLTTGGTSGGAAKIPVPRLETLGVVDDSADAATLDVDAQFEESLVQERSLLPRLHSLEGEVIERRRSGHDWKNGGAERNSIGQSVIRHRNAGRPSLKWLHDGEDS